MTAPIQLIAPIDHSKLNIRCASYEISSPNWPVSVYLHYVFEPPHGDCCQQLLANHQILPGYIWGNELYWAPCGRYLSADWTGDKDSLDRRGVLVDLAESNYLDLGKNFRAMKLEDNVLTGVDSGGKIKKIPIHASNAWKSIASQDLKPIKFK
ncbi:hypothetical protein EYS42_16650 [Aquabacterium lacunae]|uniref:Uncharacterized protein n=1 Tax=Aquabacterium lacunae TaxID=2528630 RepID=A0A4Q9GVB1_9BURK|nr:hypothetical protein EYS42_16650 [Aquabacterium lacunae]